MAATAIPTVGKPAGIRIARLPRPRLPKKTERAIPTSGGRGSKSDGAGSGSGGAGVAIQDDE